MRVGRVQMYYSGKQGVKMIKGTYRKKGAQVWEVGQVVRVGFLTLEIVDVKKLPGETIYSLVGSTGRKYEFTPHRGITAL